MKVLSFFAVATVLAGCGGHHHGDFAALGAGATAPAPGAVEARALHTATLLDDGHVLLAGGVSEKGVVAAAELYDPVAATTATLDAPVVRAGHDATPLPDGRVLLTGGTDGEHDLASAVVFDPASRTFTKTKGALNVPRSGHRATLRDDGRVLVSGGFSAALDAGGPDLPDELFDPKTGSFSLLGAPTPVHSTPPTKSARTGGSPLHVPLSERCMEVFEGKWISRALIDVTGSVNYRAMSASAEYARTRQQKDVTPDQFKQAHDKVIALLENEESSGLDSFTAKFTAIEGGAPDPHANFNLMAFALIRYVALRAHEGDVVERTSRYFRGRRHVLETFALSQGHIAMPCPRAKGDTPTWEVDEAFLRQLHGETLHENIDLPQNRIFFGSLRIVRAVLALGDNLGGTKGPRFQLPIPIRLRTYTDGYDAAYAVDPANHPDLLTPMVWVSVKNGKATWGRTWGTEPPARGTPLSETVVR